MQQVFLSYTYSPHPDYQAGSADLRKMVGMVIEAMDVREANGEDLGGQGLNDEIRARITESDALIALLVPHMPAGMPPGQPVPLQNPPWVAEEFAWAKGNGKPAIKIIHKALAVGGMFAADEYIVHDPAAMAETLLKLMRTIALWRRQQGRPTQILLSLGGSEAEFDIDAPHECECQVLTADFKRSEWRPVSIWPEPGALNVFVRGVPDKAKLRLRLRSGAVHWVSDFQSPMGRVQLTKVP
jgi:hypothetical protein